MTDEHQLSFGGYRRAVAWDVVHAGELEWEERPGGRWAASVTDPAQMTESRARMWRCAPHARGRRHLDPDQEEVFVPISGTLTALLGEPPERFDVEPGGVVAVHPGTPMLLRNDTDDEVVFFAYGAPPVTGNAQFL